MLPILTHDMDIIAKLSDEPNTGDNLSADQLKSKFDEAGNIIKAYLNDELVPGLLSAPAEDGMLKYDRGELKKAEPNFDYQPPISDGGIGTAQLSAGAVTEPKLSADAVTTSKIKDKSVTREKLADGAVVTKGTEPLTPGVSPLADGLLYVQYEVV